MRTTTKLSAVFSFAILSLPVFAAPPLPGAIFTTDANGSIVNGNTKYENACDVFLDGGPGLNAPQGAASLPDGEYFFQVTDPSGKHLLSTDPVQNRCVVVTDGVITKNCATGNHMLNVDMDHGSAGALVVQLCPYDLTPNPGGVFKAWMTPVGAFVGDPMLVDNGANDGCAQGCFHGFVPAASKTDNFKIGDGDTFDLHVQKETIVEGIRNPAPGWEMIVTDPLGSSTMHFTDGDGLLWLEGLPPGTYTVEESLEFDGMSWHPGRTDVNGEAVTPPTPVVTINGGTKKDANPQHVSWVNKKDAFQ